MWYFVTRAGEVREARDFFDPENFWPGRGMAEIRYCAVVKAAEIRGDAPTLAAIDAVALVWRPGPAYGAPSSRRGTVCPLGYDAPELAGNWREILAAYAAWAAQGDWYHARHAASSWKPRRWALDRPSVCGLAGRVARALGYPEEAVVAEAMAAAGVPCPF